MISVVELSLIPVFDRIIHRLPGLLFNKVALEDRK